MRYRRDGFALLDLAGARLMLEALGPESWLAAPAEPPFGRGINLEIRVDDLAGILARAAAAGEPVYRPAEEVWYRAGARHVGQRQAILADPDGYLLRFAEPLGDRARPPADVRVVS